MSLGKHRSLFGAEEAALQQQKDVRISLKSKHNAVPAVIGHRAAVGEDRSMKVTSLSEDIAVLSSLPVFEHQTDYFTHLLYLCHNLLGEHRGPWERGR